MSGKGPLRERLAEAQAIWLFANGDFDTGHLEGRGPAVGDIIVAVDGGLAHVQALGLAVDLLVGDFDSANADALDAAGEAERLSFPPKKNASDLELALDWVADGICAREAGETQAVPLKTVHLVGVSGGRTDHLLFNWLLAARRDWPFALDFLDATVQGFVLNARLPERRLSAVRPGQTVSLLPLGDVAGVYTEGLEYPLRHEALAAGSTRGLSNVVEATTIRIGIASGSLLVLLVAHEGAATEA